MRHELYPIHEEILRVLIRRGATYSEPIPSWELASALNVTPSYVRAQVAVLRRLKVVGVRRGRGGGYYLRAIELARREGRRQLPSRSDRLLLPGPDPGAPAPNRVDLNEESIGIRRTSLLPS